MSDINYGWFRNGTGSLTGFSNLTDAEGNPVLAKTGMSISQLYAFLSNQSEVNFPSNEMIQQFNAAVAAHISDHDNPHETTLAQIVGDIVTKLIGASIPGTIPILPAFLSYDAAVGLPIGTFFPATYSVNNLYRRTAGGWFANVDQENQIIGTDYVLNRPGIPLFSAMENVTLPTWFSDVGAPINTAIAASTTPSTSYPFTFYTVTETPTQDQFGLNIVSDHGLEVNYTTTMFLRPSVNKGTIRFSTPWDSTSYIDVNLATGAVSVYTTTMSGSCTVYPDGTLRVSINYVTGTTASDYALQLIHLNEGDTGTGIRNGSFGRPIFSIANPQTTQSTLDQPIMVDLASPAATEPLVFDTQELSLPDTLSDLTLRIALHAQPMTANATVTNASILRFGELTITRDQTRFAISVGGATQTTVPILEGYNVLAISYSPTTIIVKDLENDRLVITGTFAPLTTDIVSCGPMGGYLHGLACYAFSDPAQTCEFLANA